MMNYYTVILNIFICNANRSGEYTEHYYLPQAIMAILMDPQNLLCLIPA